MQHIEQAGIHSGDSACVVPPFSLSDALREEIRQATVAMARELNVCGLMNVQYAIKNEELYVIEVNPRASRTVPFVSKAIGHPLAKMAAKVMAGKKLKELEFTEQVIPEHYSVKESVFPFVKFLGVDIALGPEMKSTGEVMGIDADLGMAYAKAQMAAQPALPEGGNIFISVKDADKPAVGEIARDYSELGFTIYATGGTAKTLEEAGVEHNRIFKIGEGRPNILDMIKNKEIQFIVNTPSGRQPREDEVRIRSISVAHRIPIMTTLSAARASVLGIRAMKKIGLRVKSLQEYHGLV
jgi:carbamoyl-phosphate synthase large subunit